MSLLSFALSGISVGAETVLNRVLSSTGPVDYEAFGAVGDGVTDDLPAIVAAHAYANTHGLPVRTKPDAAYHLGRRALTAIIATDTDWGTSRFVVDDTDVAQHDQSIFAVRSLLESLPLPISSLTRNQRKLDIRPSRDCWVRVENDQIRRYIRRGLNRNNGSTQRDCFILRTDGTIEGDIDWDYESITSVEVRPIDEKPLVLKGGTFHHSEPDTVGRKLQLLGAQHRDQSL